MPLMSTTVVEGFFSAPTDDSIGKRISVNAQTPCPSTNGVRNPVVFYALGDSCDAGLNEFGGPANIVGEVPSIVVDAMNGMSGCWAFAKGCIYKFKKPPKILPRGIVSNSSAAIVSVHRVLNSIASSFYIFPAGVEVVRGAAPSSAMLGQSLGYNFLVQTSAAFTNPRFKHVSPYCFFGAALTPTIPECPTMGVHFSERNNNPSSNSLSFSNVHMDKVTHPNLMSTKEGG